MMDGKRDFSFQFRYQKKGADLVRIKANFHTIRIRLSQIHTFEEWPLFTAVHTVCYKKKMVETCQLVTLQSHFLGKVEKKRRGNKVYS